MATAFKYRITCLTIVFNLLLGVLSSSAQNKTYIYYFNDNIQPVPKEKATILGKGVQRDTCFWAQFYIIKDNRMFMFGSFKDSTLNSFHGQRIVYYPNRKVAEKAMYYDNKLNGLSLKMDSAGRTTDSVLYQMDSIMQSVKKIYSPKGVLLSYDSKDLINKIYSESIYTTDGKLFTDMHFNNGKGLYKQYELDGQIKTDSIFTIEKKDAKYLGNFVDLLSKNLNPRVGIYNGAPAGYYTVILRFLVDTKGNVTDIKSLTECGYGMEEEAIRVIKLSKKWTVANFYGISTSSYKIQPITFDISQR